MKQHILIPAPARFGPGQRVAYLPLREPCEPDRAFLTQQILRLGPVEAEGYVDAALHPLIDTLCALSALWEAGRIDAIPPVLRDAKNGCTKLGLHKAVSVTDDVQNLLGAGDEAALAATMARLLRLLETGMAAFSGRRGQDSL